jgi:hypothetical protein
VRFRTEPEGSLLSVYNECNGIEEYNGHDARSHILLLEDEALVAMDVEQRPRSNYLFRPRNRLQLNAEERKSRRLQK